MEKSSPSRPSKVIPEESTKPATRPLLIPSSRSLPHLPSSSVHRPQNPNLHQTLLSRNEEFIKHQQQTHPLYAAVNTLEAQQSRNGQSLVSIKKEAENENSDIHCSQNTSEIPQMPKESLQFSLSNQIQPSQPHLRTKESETTPERPQVPRQEDGLLNEVDCTISQENCTFSYSIESFSEFNDNNSSYKEELYSPNNDTYCSSMSSVSMSSISDVLDNHKDLGISFRSVWNEDKKDKKQKEFDFHFNHTSAAGTEIRNTFLCTFINSGTLVYGKLYLSCSFIGFVSRSFPTFYISFNDVSNVERATRFGFNVVIKIVLSNGDQKMFASLRSRDRMFLHICELLASYHPQKAQECIKQYLASKNKRASLAETSYEEENDTIKYEIENETSDCINESKCHCQKHL
eukprot:Pgem_evm1s19144